MALERFGKISLTQYERPAILECARLYPFHVPNDDCLVVGCRCKEITVRRPCNVVDSLKMTFTCFQNFTSICVPNLDRLVRGLLRYRILSDSIQIDITNVPEDASRFPSGLNLSEDTDIVCPLSINFV